MDHPVWRGGYRASVPAGGLSAINRALNLVPKRADQSQAQRLRDTFVDSGVSAALEAVDHQVVYGRRGTGKTHALRYLEAAAHHAGDMALYLDLRTIGSPAGLFGTGDVPATERTARLLVDLLAQLHDELLSRAVDDPGLLGDHRFVDALDRLAGSITSVRVGDEVEVERSGEAAASTSSSTRLGVAARPAPGVAAQVGSAQAASRRSALRETRRGTERIGMVFGDVARALRDVTGALHAKRVWLLLDEWSSVPIDVQPMLAEFLVRCVLPLQRVTVKIAAIEQQSRFMAHPGDGPGQAIGIELGADVAASLDLDDFMVFEQNEDRARAFFRGLLFKHLVLGAEPADGLDGLRTENDLVREGFADSRAFDELVRAAEGVPRDAINIAAKAGMRAGAARISLQDVRFAARSWFQTDKVAALRSREEALHLLYWIIDVVIRGKRARGFLVNQRAEANPLLLTLFDARVLHVVRRGYSAQDEPGERYDVWVVDYGAYVDLMHTSYEPRGLLPGGDEEGGGWVDVPTQDLRAVRRAILDLDRYEPA
jgi:hypothetical protein